MKKKNAARPYLSTRRGGFLRTLLIYRRSWGLKAVFASADTHVLFLALARHSRAHVQVMYSRTDFLWTESRVHSRSTAKAPDDSRPSRRFSTRIMCTRRTRVYMYTHARARRHCRRRRPIDLYARLHTSDV